ncbi:hypothetical protein PRIPAC_90770 [Pristionchus pacificus]|uniref:Zinc finger protein n=1 Tax=Pristionchus pacificus TaxID=54126 RepID=A0A2A6B6R8_PRIPA|nr:hypothetical protein PRIPAC_90770 [Pristionchus pacificus]|eukprot:PDM61567.1 zinc finger protein [Pristionchus pacificus]
MDETVERINHARKAACEVLADDNIAMPLIKLMDVSRLILERGLHHSCLEENINSLISDAVRTRRQDDSVDPVRGLLYDALEVIGRTFISIRSSTVLSQVPKPEEISESREFVERIALLESGQPANLFDSPEDFSQNLPTSSQALLTPKFEEVNGSSMEEANYSFQLEEDPQEDLTPADEEDSYRDESAWPANRNSSVDKRKARNEWICADCGEVYTSRASLRVHARAHKANISKNFVCADCGKSYASSKTLRMHKTIHKALEQMIAARFASTFDGTPMATRDAGVSAIAEYFSLMSSSDNDALSLNRLPSDVINMIIGVGIEFVDSMKLVRPAEAINRVSRQAFALDMIRTISPLSLALQCIEDILETDILAVFFSQAVRLVPKIEFAYNGTEDTEVDLEFMEDLRSRLVFLRNVNAVVSKRTEKDGNVTFCIVAMKR